jgi:hypothetical protein
MSSNPNPPQFAPGSWAVPQQPFLLPPQLVDRIPDGQPLVLKPRLSRFVTVFGTIYVVFPLVLFLGLSVLLIATMGGPGSGRRSPCSCRGR